MLQKKGFAATDSKRLETCQLLVTTHCSSTPHPLSFYQQAGSSCSADVCLMAPLRWCPLARMPIIGSSATQIAFCIYCNYCSVIKLLRFLCIYTYTHIYFFAVVFLICRPTFVRLSHAATQVFRKQRVSKASFMCVYK